MRWVYLLVLAVLVALAGTAAYFYFEPSGAGLLAIFGFVFRNALRRMVSRTLWFVLTPFVPAKRRRQIKRLNHRCRDFFRRLTHNLWWRLWKWERVATAIALVVLVGYAATYYSTAWSILSVFIPKTEISIAVGMWTREVVFPYLVRTFAGIGVERFVPDAWKRIPGMVRKPLDRSYWVAWWWAAPKMVHGRRAFGLWIKYDERKRIVAKQFIWRKPAS